jgi:hypothetical protein
MPALLLGCAWMTAAPLASRADAPTDASLSVDAETLLSWAMNRRDVARIWELRIADQREIVDRLSCRIECLNKEIKEVEKADSGKAPTLRLLLDLTGHPRPSPRLVVVSRVDGKLHFRVFDPLGRMIEDKDEDGSDVDTDQLPILKRYLSLDERWWTSPELIPSWARDLIVVGVTAILGLNTTDFLTRLDRVDTKLREAEEQLSGARLRAGFVPPHLARLMLESAELRLLNVRRDRDRLLGETLANQEMNGAADAARSESSKSGPLPSDLAPLRDRERAKLAALEAQAAPSLLSAGELAIMGQLKKYLDEKEKHPDEAKRSLSEASRLWRQEAARRLGSEPGATPAAFPGAPPGH